jgi:hypothetical protein
MISRYIIKYIAIWASLLAKSPQDAMARRSAAQPGTGMRRQGPMRRGRSDDRDLRSANGRHGPDTRRFFWRHPGRRPLRSHKNTLTIDNPPQGRARPQDSAQTGQHLHKHSVARGTRAICKTRRAAGGQEFTLSTFGKIAGAARQKKPKKLR